MRSAYQFWESVYQIAAASAGQSGETLRDNTAVQSTSREKEENRRCQLWETDKVSKIMQPCVLIGRVSQPLLGVATLAHRWDTFKLVNL